MGVGRKLLMEERIDEEGCPGALKVAVAEDHLLQNLGIAGVGVAKLIAGDDAAGLFATLGGGEDELGAALGKGGTKPVGDGAEAAEGEVAVGEGRILC